MPMRPASSDPRAAWLMRLGDATLILGHRLSEWLSRAPTLEEDIALANLSLDLIGQTRAFYTRACELEGGTRDETLLAYRRTEPDFRNPLIVEQPNGNFADTIVRHLIFSAYAAPLYEKIAGSIDPETAGIATRSAREMAYHLRHSGEWTIRLGDGTAESHAAGPKARSTSFGPTRPNSSRPTISTARSQGLASVSIPRRCATTSTPQSTACSPRLA